jgi:hypothetical protein
VNLAVPLPTRPTLRPADSFHIDDRKHWDALAKKHARQYDMPRWHLPCTVESMSAWLDRLDVKPSEWRAVGAFTDLADFARLNPEWPLRAFVGLVLEYVSERALFAKARA